MLKTLKAYPDIELLDDFDAIADNLASGIAANLSSQAEENKEEKEAQAQEKIQITTEDQIEEASGVAAISGAPGGFGPPNKYNPFKSLRRKRK